MAGITTPDSVLERVQALLREYLNAEVDLIDTRNNTVAGVGSVNNFDTPNIPDACVQLYVDRLSAQPVRIVVADGGNWSDNEFQLMGHEAMTGSTEPSSNTPRLDRTMRFVVGVRAAADGGVETTDGETSADHARRVCNRIAEAVRVIIARYPTLSIPATSTASLVPGGVQCSGDTRAADVDDDSTHYYSREITYEARLIESRA